MYFWFLLFFDMLLAFVYAHLFFKKKKRRPTPSSLYSEVLALFSVSSVANESIQKLGTPPSVIF